MATRRSFTTIGALPDFSDELVLYCFGRVIMLDPDRRATHFQCLRDIATSRDSEALTQRISLLELQGFVGQAEVEEAFEYFGIRDEKQSIISDEQLLGEYRSRLYDIGKNEEVRAKQALSTIAKARNSGLLVQNAHAHGESISKHHLSQASAPPANKMSDHGTLYMEDVDYMDIETDRLVAELETYDQAIAFLESTPATTYEGIIAMGQFKASENDVNNPLAAKALEIIARHRNSEVILAEAIALGSGKSMSLQYAYTLLGVVENAEEVEDDMIVTAHSIKLQDAPGRATELNEALSIIAESRNSDRLRYTVSSLSGNAVHIGPSSNGYGAFNLSITEPRGLNNIGNTCYLNSLLQYLFTIKPVRDMVEHFDDYKQVLPSEQEPFSKKVADMHVDRAGVERTQACKTASFSLQ